MYQYLKIKLSKKNKFFYKLWLFRKLQRLNEDLQEKLDTLQGELIHQNIR